MRVLIVEDSPSQASIASDIVRSLPGWCCEIRDTLAGSLAAAELCDVALVDLELPDSPAANTLSRLREFPIPVIVCSEHADKQRVIATIHKPFSPREVEVALLQAQLQVQRRQRLAAVDKLEGAGAGAT